MLIDHKTTYRLLFFLLGCLCTNAARAQYPVQVLPFANASNSTLLSDYYTGKQTGLGVMLRNLDYSRPLVQGYLRISIEGQGVKLQTGSYAIFPSIDLMEGSSVNLGPSDLAVYFKPQNLQGSIGFGVNQPNVFPEGFYQICFEVLEKNTSRLIGSMQCVQAHFSFSDPVELSLPQNRQKLNADQAEIKFQWKPQHRNLAHSEYQFALVELELNDKVSESAFARAKPIYSSRTKTEQLVYDTSMPALVKGKKYAWRVLVSALTETGEKEPFKNDGYSEIYFFELK